MWVTFYIAFDILIEHIVNEAWGLSMDLKLLAAHIGKRTVKISSDLAYDCRASGVSIGDVVNSSGYAGSTRPE